ncbi:hypothetical protein GCM10011369_36040 [Neiella marina]|uniref:DUF1254 domain-containing protein n=1 Tax=Neiella marina TaxID=508461 RepID=A0A8J2UAY3_9GAMM|nr:DUF6491 family protein [Neiella marina]GGA90702.1 hypothetical protein GCM10011369_36040 [Neiella marina]
MSYIKTLLVTVFMLVAVGCATTEAGSEQARVTPNYNFEQLEQVDRFRPSNNFSMAAWNSQVLLLSDSVKTKYLLILQRPDTGFDFQAPVGIKRFSSYITAGQDRVYALNTVAPVGITIRTIYKLDDKEDLELAKKLVTEAEQAAKAANAE